MFFLDSIPVFILITVASVMLLLGVGLKNRGISLGAIPVIFLGVVLGIIMVFEHTYTIKWGYVAITASIAWLSVFISMAIDHERKQRPSEPTTEFDESAQ